MAYGARAASALRVVARPLRWRNSTEFIIDGLLAAVASRGVSRAEGYTAAHRGLNRMRANLSRDSELWSSRA